MVTVRCICGTELHTIEEAERPGCHFNGDSHHAISMAQAITLREQQEPTPYVWTPPTCERVDDGIRWVDIDQVKIGERRKNPELVFGNFRKEFR